MIINDFINKLGMARKRLENNVLEFGMFNWSTDEAYFKKNAPLEYRRWRVLQLINYGLDGEKLNEHLVRQMWPEIKDEILSSEIRDYLEFVLWPEKQS